MNFSRDHLFQAINILQSCVKRRKEDSNLDVRMYCYGANIQSRAFAVILKSVKILNCSKSKSYLHVAEIDQNCFQGYKMPFVTTHALNEYDFENMLLHLPLNWNDKILFRIPSKFSPLIEKMVSLKSCRILHSMPLTVFAFVDLDRAKHLQTK